MNGGVELGGAVPGVLARLVHAHAGLIDPLARLDHVPGGAGPVYGVTEAPVPDRDLSWVDGWMDAWAGKGVIQSLTIDQHRRV